MEKEIRLHGEYRTRHLVLEACDRMITTALSQDWTCPKPELLANPKKQVACS